MLSSTLNKFHQPPTDITPQVVISPPDKELNCKKITSASYTVQSTDDIVCVYSSPCEIILPDAHPRILYIKDAGVSETTNITVRANMIDGEPTYTLDASFDAITLAWTTDGQYHML